MSELSETKLKERISYLEHCLKLHQIDIEKVEAERDRLKQRLEDLLDEEVGDFYL